MSSFAPNILRWLLLILVMSINLSAQNPPAGEDIRGPKPLVEIPVPEEPPVALAAGVAGGLLLLAGAWFFWKRRAAKMHLKSPPEVALANLSELEANRESIAAEAFANRAAQVIRQYIADRFGVAAPRRTTEEFLRNLTEGSETPLISESDHLRTFLRSCDLAKFAGSHLDSAQRGALLQTARDFVIATNTKPPVGKS